MALRELTYEDKQESRNHSNLGSDSKIWARSNEYSTLKSLIERCFVEQETGWASSYSITIAKYWYFDSLKTQLALCKIGDDKR